MRENTKRRAICRAAVVWRAVDFAAMLRRKLRAGDCAAARWKQHVACCAIVLALVLLLCGDMVLPPRQSPLLPELRAVEQQLRALTADAPDGWRYSVRISPGPDGTALTADAARRDASGAWETIHTLWRPENGTWRMVRQAHQTHRPPPGAGGEHE